MYYEGNERAFSWKLRELLGQKFAFDAETGSILGSKTEVEYLKISLSSGASQGLAASVEAK